MNINEIVRVDEIKWWVAASTTGERLPVPLCPIHSLRLTPIRKRILGKNGVTRDQFDSEVNTLKCEEGPHIFNLQRTFKKERQYVLDRIDAKVFSRMKVLNLDDEALPIAKTKVQTEDGKYFVTSQLMKSKRGIQVVIYAGEKGSPHKTQIFVDPDVKRLTFDQKDLHPNDVFIELKATFRDGSSHFIFGKTDEG